MLYATSINQNHNVIIFHGRDLLKMVSIAIFLNNLLELDPFHMDLNKMALVLFQKFSLNLIDA